MKTKTLVVILLLSAVAFAGERVKSIYKVSRFTPTTLGVSCTNGADPTVAGNVGGVLVISCGK